MATQPDTPMQLHGNTNLKGRLNTINLLVLTSLDPLPLLMKTLFTLYKTSYFNEEVNRTEPFPSVSIPCHYWHLYFAVAKPGDDPIKSFGLKFL
jgi:hypothetical protein